MPNLKWIFIVFLSAISLLNPHLADCQANNLASLQKADSLFSQKKYKEALKIYEDILYEENTYSPAMLLKMSFISEGMGEFGQASLFLSRYYEHNPNPEVIDKIKSLTNQSRLEGYELSDQDRFLSVLVEYKMEITAFFALLLVVCLIMAFILPGKRSVFVLPASVFLILAFVSNNFIHTSETAIVTGSPVLIMDSPSAAGNLVRRVEAGHRVTISSSQDIWYKITWENREAYIKKSDVSKI
ncbi:SH3 domain-containing protein [Cyclobacterium jeungdonense]|uniref:SH3 domain-containing protein n=1 Tax=Cyclobacterium jeungdonense TaxID=708087 RepID=A0ABT8C7I3_9BACT|nr:SH3 domain-containing protein [Cyclobacterium jeungdonense]MDN3687568.1 SH3 domain-containing protein [Cyclobacterium jeungdonense]